MIRNRLGLRTLDDAVLDLARGHRSSLAKMASTSLVGGLAEAGLLVLLTQIVFAVVDGSEEITLAGFGLGVPLALGLTVVALILRFILARAGNQLVSSVMQDVLKSQRARILRSFLLSEHTNQERVEPGRFQELSTTFAGAISVLIAALSNSIVAACNLLTLLVVAVFVSPLGAIALLLVGFGLSKLLAPLRGRVRRTAAHLSSSNMNLATVLNDVSRIGLEAKIFGVEAELISRVSEQIDNNAEDGRRHVSTRGMVPIIYTTLAYGALSLAVFAMVASSASTAPNFGAVMLLLLRSLSYGQAFQSSQAMLESNTPYLKSLNRTVDELACSSEAPLEDSLSGFDRIRFDSVSFSYSGSSESLRAISLEIESGDRLGVIGPSGSGKSTLVQLMLGLRMATQGSVTVNGTPVSHLSNNARAQLMGFVPQTPKLITGTIAENIAFFRAVPMEQIVRAARQAHIHEEIESLPGGYEHILRSDNLGLSGGQQQRVCIARSLLLAPELLLLDEPTSALDSQSEERIRETLQTLTGKCTLVIVAHRMTTLRSCNKILVLQRGEVEAFGSPEEVAKRSQYFRDSLRRSELP